MNRVIARGRSPEAIPRMGEIASSHKTLLAMTVLIPTRFS
jgi:hypothetical protein